eukprot:TRINITY_DN13735_c0_g1_i1.p1 TRINITY_DN13735_c0_g1~~TRINITY_DN13735_c0_g1_i1.p1  ORF type:complete len:207 (+),score=45.26 TRINITY_DN13735_c0_g1_i1:53-622(+)
MEGMKKRKSVPTLDQVMDTSDQLAFIENMKKQNEENSKYFRMLFISMAFIFSFFKMYAIYKQVTDPWSMSLYMSFMSRVTSSHLLIVEALSSICFLTNAYCVVYHKPDIMPLYAPIKSKLFLFNYASSVLISLFWLYCLDWKNQVPQLVMMAGGNLIFSIIIQFVDSTWIHSHGEVDDLNNYVYDFKEI